MDFPGADHRVAHDRHYEAMSARQTARLLDAARIRAGDRVLDVGCGTGATTRLAARRAGPGGGALGVDLSRAMLAQAELRAREEGVPEARFEQADAAERDFAESSYDVVISQYGVMFFADPDAAFAGPCRALRPGGRLAFLCWQPARRNELQTVVDRAAAAYVPVPGPDRPGEPGPFSLADGGHVRRLLADAGFGAVAVEAVEEPLWLGDDPARAAAFVCGRVRMRGLLQAADADTADRARAAVRGALEAYATPEGVLVGAPAWLVTGERPARG